MTVKLLMDWPDSRNGRQYVAGNLLTTDAGTETGLVNAKMATSDLTGGTNYVAPVPQTQYKTAQLATVGGGVSLIAGDTAYGLNKIRNRYDLKSQAAARLMLFRGAASFSKSAVAGFTVADDTTNKYNGKPTVKMTLPTALGGAITKLMTAPVDISTSDNITVTYYLPDTIPASGAITVYLASDAVLNTLTNRIQGVFPLGGVARPGWNTFTLLKSEFTTSGSPDLTSIKQVRLRVDQSSGASYDVSVAELLFGYKHRPTITLMADDGYVEQYAKSGLTATPDGMDGGFYSYLKYKQLPGSIAVIGSKVGYAGGAGFFSEANLLEMIANGFDFVTHGEENLVTHYATDAERFANIELNRNYLKSRGVTDGADCYVYPEGQYSLSIQSYLRAAGFLGARTLFSPSTLSGVTHGFGPYCNNKFAVHSCTMGNQTYSSIKPIIDRAVSMGHSLLLYCHLLTTGAPGGDTQKTQYSEFTQIVDYVAGLRDQDIIDVVSFLRLCRMIGEQEFSVTPEPAIS